MTGEKFLSVPSLSLLVDSHRSGVFFGCFGVCLFVFCYRIDTMLLKQKKSISISPDMDVGDRADGSLHLRAFDTFRALHADSPIQEGTFDSPPIAALWSASQ